MNLKKVMAIGIALSIVTGTTASAFAEDSNTATALDKFRQALQEQKEREMVLDSQLAEESSLQGLKDSDKVRVIVELEGDAVIEKATVRGVNVSEISKSEVKSLQKSILKEQSSIQSKIKSKGIKFDIINSFTNVTNGFSISTTLGGAKELEAISGVKSVTIANEYERPEPDMNNSGDITETPVAWANGYTGEGTVISIIDTGVDPSHKDMVLTDGSKAELDKAEVEGVVSEKSLPGKYYTEKVPYGYNYMDENNQILDIGPDASEHGMHVAGIAGANGDVKDGGIKGTAPEAQILAMKVFGNNPAMSSTFGDVIIKAIDDSVILGADVINMSLGSTASFVDDNDPEQMAVNRAVDNGVVVAISSGNSGTFGYGLKTPYAQNPDYGVVGSPGLATKSIQVASIENNITTGDGIEFTVNGEEKIYPYTTAGEDILTVLKGQQLKAVDCGLGGLPEHFPAAVKGNVALIERGTYDFATKIANAEKAGAIAVIVYNNAANGDALLNMAYPEGCKIPAIFMGHSGGVLIQENLKVDGFTVSFNGNATSAHNPNAGKMADSSSWGTTPDLEFKPEITGVGGNVWSLAQNNGYRNMSGTSMASPNVAGGSALVLQRVDKLFDLTGEERVQMAKNILMSTALPHVDKGLNQDGSNYTSPRRQGAGVMNLAGATETNAIVTDTSTGISKVNLKEINGDIATFTITVENFGDKELTYNLGGTVQTDIAYQGNTLLEADNIVDATTGEFPISFNSDTVTVAPKSTKDIMVRVDLSNAVSAIWEKPISELFVNGGYVEGFVTLTSVDDSVPELSIPYVGFKGEWDKAPIIDASIYDKDRKSYYGYTAMMTPTDEEGTVSYMGLPYGATSTAQANGNFIDISPDGDGYNDSVLPMLSYLRNSKEVIVEILNSEGKVIRTLDKIENARKHYYNGGKNVRSFLNDAQWDGTINGKIVEDGTYTYRIKAKVDYKDADWQNFDYKINVDLTAPELKNTSVDTNKKTLTMVGTDNFEGHVYAYLLSTPLGVYISPTGVFDISKELDAGYTVKNFEAGVSDYAQNMSVYDLGLPIGAVPGDKDAPVVKLTSPEFFGNYDSNTVNFAGTFTDKSAVELVKINGEEVPLTYNKKTGAYDFSINLNIENGYHSVKVYSKDAAGNELEFAHKLFVDAEPPVLNLEDIPAQTTEGAVFINGTATDNFPDLKIFVNGNLVEKIVGEWEYFDQQKPASYTFDNYEVPLVDGENTINVEIVDAMGHKAAKIITVNKVEDVVDTTAPAAPTVTRDGDKIVITAVDPADAARIEYSYDQETWEVYTEPIQAKEGSTIYAVAIDAANNRSEATPYIIEDLTPPAKPVANLVDGLVVAEAADEDTSYIEYSLDGNGWARYTEGLQIAEGQTVYFRAVDGVGHVSEEVEEFTMPDTTAPSAPYVYEKDGVVTVVATDKDTAKLEYSFDKETWNEYTEPVKGEPETVVYVRAVDAAGNPSEIVEVEIPKLIIPDTTAPLSPKVTIEDGILTIEASDDDTAKIEYSLNGKEWIAYTEAVKVADNDLIHVRAIDAAGNISEVKVYKVPATVDPNAPEKPVAPTVTEKDGVVTVTAADEVTDKLEYSLDGKTWVPYTEPVKVDEKVTIEVRAINVEGDKASISDVVKYTVPDRTAPKAPKMSANKNMVTITAQDEDVVKIEYSLDKETWTEYKDPVKLAAKKTMYARAIDGAGNVSEISKLTMPSSGNTLPQTGGMVGTGLMGLGGVVAAAFGVLMLKKRNRK